MIIKNLTIKNNTLNKNLINDFSATLEEGKILGIYGVTGSGKSSILNWLCGILSSNFSAEGEKACNEKEVSCAFQEPRVLENISVIKNVCLGNNKASIKDDAAKILTVFGLGDKMPCKAGNLSGGEKQRVNVARAICKNAKLYLFDEPVASQDKKNAEIVRQEIKNHIKKTNAFCIVTAHEKNELTGFADSVIEI